MRIIYYTNENTQESQVTLEKDGVVKHSHPLNQKEYEEYKTLHERINSDFQHMKLFYDDMSDEEL